MEENNYKFPIKIGIVIGTVSWIICSIFCSCTISLSNISTHGTAQDLVDETQSASPRTQVTATVPVSAVP